MRLLRDLGGSKACDRVVYMRDGRVRGEAPAVPSGPAAIQRPGRIEASHLQAVGVLRSAR